VAFLRCGQPRPGRAAEAGMAVGDAPMAQLRWQKPADGSDTLAMARIRWQRTAWQQAGVRSAAARAGPGGVLMILCALFVLCPNALAGLLPEPDLPFC
jgi:hypothetical protein